MTDFIEEKDLRILILEDVLSDAELEEAELREAGLEFTMLRVETREAFERALDEFKPDIILSDYKLPAYNGRDALEYARKMHPQIPVIMVTGALGDVAAVELFKLGAKDYVLKDSLARLAPAIKRALAEERDIRNRKLAEEKYLALFSEAMDGIVLIDCNTWQIEDCNPEFERQTGRTLEQLKELRAWELLPTEQQELARQTLLEIQQDKARRGSNFTLQTPGGEIVPIEFSAKFLNIQQHSFIQLVTRDITERKHAEASLAQLNRALKTLSEGNRALVHATDEEQLMRDICRAATESGGYVLAWAGHAHHDVNKSIEPIAISGWGTEYVKTLNLTWADQPRGRGPTGSAVRTGQTQVVQDFAQDPRMEPWREAAAKFGYNSSIALPLKQDGQVLGVLSIYAAETGAFGVDEVALLEEMAGDLAYGIVTLRTRKERDQAIEERQQYLNQIHSSLEGSIDAIAATVEMRDPYTAGHQRRVAELASAIGQELGLPEEQVHGMHLAGTVHDLGKICIPAEILSKPGRLTGLEFELIKNHAQAGYDILKEIDFPWPIAQMVLQHHERLDGTGYPQGLKGDAIILEARILAVADVVEAMISHRPYRPALGADAALEEISHNRGVLYDSKVVDVCLALFREKGFAFQ